MKLDGTDGNGKGEFEVDYSRETRLIMGEEGRDGTRYPNETLETLETKQSTLFSKPLGPILGFLMSTYHTDIQTTFSSFHSSFFPSSSLPLCLD